ncbi:sensor histidine kinase [Variovorax sp. RT4R15]|uniref:sensor histidine kinase n=1 Tax=Variovorax sp. RT4R15 TaxID=3443737 RepID=UPI003F46B6BD
MGKPDVPRTQTSSETMQLADFLELAREEILAESVTYAKTILLLKDEDEVVLRDHLPKVLKAISADLRTAQSRTESIEKSHGDPFAAGTTRETAAETHGLVRARSGLHIEQVIAEYRALRSCVVRLWSEAAPPDPNALHDVGRFNEAIDQALAESVRVYAAEVERWRQIFLGVLGHDLRGPLNAIAMTAEIIARKAPRDLALPTATLTRSTRRMASLMDSLLEYNRAGLGSGMAIERVSIDLEAACSDELELQRAALPGATIELAVRGDTRGEFDGSRIREALGNLVTNAVKHGISSEPVMVRLEGEDQVVRLIVENAATHEIGANEMEQLFEPLRRRAAHKPGPDRSHFGLGLFIVRQIAKVHGGEVHGHSSPHRVQFTVTLPKSSHVRPRRSDVL